MLTSRRLKELENKLQEAICPHCIERDVHGNCQLWQPAVQCPMLLHLRRIVEIAATIDSDRMSDYILSVRSTVCPACQNAASPNGTCDLRDQGHCALDAYLPLILEVLDGFVERNAVKRAE